MSSSIFSPALNISHMTSVKGNAMILSFDHIFACSMLSGCFKKSSISLIHISQT